MRVTEIILKLKDVNQMLIVPHNVFYENRMLSPIAEELLIEESQNQPYRTTIIRKCIYPGTL